MSGPGKKVVDVAFKAGKTIDWEGMAKMLVSDDARREFSNLRRAFDEVNTQLQTKFSQVPFSFFRFCWYLSRLNFADLFIFVIVWHFDDLRYSIFVYIGF